MTDTPTPETPATYQPPAPPTRLTPALYEAVIDLCWRAVQYGETDDGDTAYYLVTKGTMHRLIGAAQGAGVPAAFRAANPDTPREDQP